MQRQKYYEELTHVTEGGEVPWRAVCKLEAQEGRWCSFSANPKAREAEEPTALSTSLSLRPKAQ